MVVIVVIVVVRMMSKFRNIIMLLNSRKKEHFNKCEISNLITNTIMKLLLTAISRNKLIHVRFM